MRRQRIADARLHVAPPAMIGAAEPHQMRTAGVVTRQPHRLHHGFGARHVEGDFVEAGNLLQELHVLGDHGMIEAEHRSKRAHLRGATLDRLLVEIVAEDIDAIGTAQVVEAVAVEIGHGDAVARLQERSRRQARPHIAAVLERHPVGVGELQIGNAVRGFRGAPDGLGKACLVERGQPVEAGAAARRYVRGGIVGAKETRLIVVVKRHQRREPAGKPGMAGERSVLGLRQSEPPPQLHQRGRQRRTAGPIKRQGRCRPSRHDLSRHGPNRHGPNRHGPNVVIVVAQVFLANAIELRFTRRS